MTLAAIGKVIWSWLKSLPGWVWWIVLAVLTATYIDMRARGQQRKADQADEAKRDGEEQRRVDQTRREISEENQDAIRRADEAVRDLPGYRATDELRNNDPGNAAIVLGTGARHGE